MSRVMTLVKLGQTRKRRTASAVPLRAYSLRQSPTATATATATATPTPTPTTTAIPTATPTPTTVKRDLPTFR